MKYGSVCSGIEAASVAWEPLGWKPQWFSEIEAFPSAVLAHHWPEVPNLGDMTNFKEWSNDPIDVLVGGTPCQSFSVAGLRKGLADPRGNLMLTFGAIAAKYRPRWLVWENVPGVLSSNGGRDFGTFLGMLGELGYGFAYRVLDAQYFGVAQRRRRVFVVACLGDWRAAAAVLFERESLSGNPAPSREAGQEAAGTLASRTGAGGFPGTDEACSGDVQPMSVHENQRAEVTLRDTAGAVKCAGGKPGQGYSAVLQPVAVQNATRGKSQNGLGVARPGDPMYTLDNGSQHGVCCVHGTQDLNVRHDQAHALGRNSGQENAIAMPILEPGKRTGKSTTDPRAGLGIGDDGEPMYTLQAGAQHGVATGLAVRRLLPVECERLQGFPDGHTSVPYRNKPATDGPRYKAIGNSMAVPVMRWIGGRIQSVTEILKAVEAA